jgi:hypothetical protein
MKTPDADDLIAWSGTLLVITASVSFSALLVYGALRLIGIVS